MKRKRVNYLGCLSASALTFLLVGCQSGSRIRHAEFKEKATDEVIERALMDLDRNAAASRHVCRDRGFAAFEKSVYLEPFEGGKYIVNGDTPIASRKQLEEFFETHIKRDATTLRSADLVVDSVGGEDNVWDQVQKKQLTFCVSTSFGSRYDQVVQTMEDAAAAWETCADVDFIHIWTQDGSCTASNGNVVFDVRPVDVGGLYLARAFFPNEPRAARNVLIDKTALDLDPGTLTLTGILRHELGHTLGFRHEHTRPEAGACFEDDNWTPITDYDEFSVMHYPQCNGGGDWSLTLTHLDKNGTACLYGPAEGFSVDPTVCVAEVPPEAPACSVQTHHHHNQRVAQNAEKQFGPFDVAPGTIFAVEMVGTGDPDLYVQFGSAPTRSPGGYTCRPYLNGAEESCSLDVPAGTSQAFVMVRGYRAGQFDLLVTFTSN